MHCIFSHAAMHMEIPRSAPVLSFPMRVHGATCDIVLGAQVIFLDEPVNEARCWAAEVSIDNEERVGLINKYPSIPYQQLPTDSAIMQRKKSSPIV